MCLFDMKLLPPFTGRLDEGERTSMEVLNFARRVHVRLVEQNVLMVLAGIRLARCDFEGSATALDEVGADNYWVDLLWATRAEMSGDQATAVELLPSPERAAGLPYFLGHVHGARARILFNAGRHDDAREELRAWRHALDRVPTGPPVTASHFHAHAEADECLSALAEEDVARAAYDDLVRWSPLRFAPYSSRGIDHLRGALALRLDRLDEAEQWYRTGLEWAERERCPVEQGRCLEGLAEVALQRGQHAEAEQFFDRAAVLFEQHGALFYLQRLQARREALRA